MGVSREFSAGGVVLRTVEGRHEIAVIRPRGRNAVALPKGHIDPGETPAIAAQREIREETGLTVELDRPLGEINYVYRFQRRTIAKQVTFFLFRWRSGEVGAIDWPMRREVQAAWWLPLASAVTELSYPGERAMAAKALTAMGADQG